MAKDLTCFKAYDVRGRLGVDLDEEIVYRIGRAFAETIGTKIVVLGRDVRASSEDLARNVAQGLMDAGCTVLDLGVSGTEEMYFATSHFDADGGICVTASHNPMDYNGMKLVKSKSVPLDPDTDLRRVKEIAERSDFGAIAKSGERKDVSVNARAAYVDCVCRFVDVAALKPMKILVNAGHGAAGPTFDAIVEKLESLEAPLTFERIFHEPDSTFPQGIPNPLLAENRPATAQAVRDAGADFGIAWDGDFDRCFFFDHMGEFVDGEYIVVLLAQSILAKSKGEAIIHDPRIIWSIRDGIDQAGGKAVQSRCGHALIKQNMRKENAIYGGEMSAHHYFRDFAYCDSGMIPWLMIAQRLSEGSQLAELQRALREAYPSSGEINFVVGDVEAAFSRVRKVYESDAVSIDTLDGFSAVFPDWRFNLRMSATEPVVRLNVESRGDADLVETKVNEIKALLSVV